MKKLILYSVFGFSFLGCSQNNNLSSLLKKYNKETIPYIYVETLKDKKNNVILLDAREEKEYKTSHIKNALYVGYDTFNINLLKKKNTNKDAKIVVYCSIGVRSEVIALKLKKAGYKNIYNLYGGIFEWKNNNNKIYDSNENETDNVHTYSKKWSKWLRKGTKIYD